MSSVDPVFAPSSRVHCATSAFGWYPAGYRIVMCVPKRAAANISEFDTLLLSPT